MQESDFNPLQIHLKKINGVRHACICISTILLRKWCPYFALNQDLQYYLENEKPGLSVITLSDLKQIQNEIHCRCPNTKKINLVIKDGVLMCLHIDNE
jgi:hypothetical protein